jgi:hypothetical protein
LSAAHLGCVEPITDLAGHSDERADRKYSSAVALTRNDQSRAYWESLYLSMRRGVFAAGANTYCTTKSSGYAEISASFNVTGSAGVAACVLDGFFAVLGIVAILLVCGCWTDLRRGERVAVDIQPSR